jgi:sensor histidine kinase YesM
MKVDYRALKNEKNWTKEFVQYLLIFFVGGTFQELILERQILDLENFEWMHVFRNGAFWLLLWKGSEYLVLIQDKTGIRWVEQPVKRLILALTLSLSYVFLAVSLIFLFFFVTIGDWTMALFLEKISITWYLPAVIITLSINTVMHGRAFLLEWKQAAVEVEKFRTESLQSKYESLKNQVNPHFLFNSLNALSSLVYEDQDKAVEFIRKLSQVYRYVLDKKDMELVPLEDELAFLENYVFLQKIRFGDNLKLTLEVESTQGMVPPIALQILVENAIKHNVISEKKPLDILVEVKADHCQVTNTIQEKLEKDSTGIGLSNLRARYDFLSERKVEIRSDQGQFVVRIPILKVKE